MWYLPIAPHLQRLYASLATAKHMKCHYVNGRPRGALSHPSEGEGWKDFKKTSRLCIKTKKCDIEIVFG